MLKAPTTTVTRHPMPPAIRLGVAGLGRAFMLMSPALPHAYGTARAALRRLASADDAAALKAARMYGVASVPASGPPPKHNHFGGVIASCARADLRPMADGIHIYGNDRRDFVHLAAPAIARFEVVDELIAAVRDNRPPLHSGAWGRATLEVCLAILESVRSGQEIRLTGQSSGWTGA